MPWKRRDGKWVGQVREGGRRIQKTFDTKSEALGWESHQRETPVERWQTRTGFSHTLGGLANEYLDYSKIKHSEKTYKEKRDLFKRLFHRIDPNTPPQRLASDDLRFYLQSQATERSGYASNKDRKNLLAFQGWVNRYKGMQVVTVSQTEKFPEIRAGRYVPPEEDFWRVYETAVGQDRTMLLTYLHLAARMSELFRLRWEDVDFGEKRVRLFTRKRKDGSMEADWLPLTDDLYSALLAQRDFISGEFVFPKPGGGPYAYRIHFMERLCRRAGVRKFGWHAIRHLSATLLSLADVPLITISQILRHKNLATTEKYLKRLGHLRAALEVLKRKAF